MQTISATKIFSFQMRIYQLNEYVFHIKGGLALHACVCSLVQACTCGYWHALESGLLRKECYTIVRNLHALNTNHLHERCEFSINKFAIMQLHMRTHKTSNKTCAWPFSVGSLFGVFLYTVVVHIVLYAYALRVVYQEVTIKAGTGWLLCHRSF